jgi:hypothetical protein
MTAPCEAVDNGDTAGPRPEAVDGSGYLRARSAHNPSYLIHHELGR